MDDLWRQNCFKKHLVKDLTAAQRKMIYGSRFHHKIKRHTHTGELKSLKTLLVVMGNQMKLGKSYLDCPGAAEHGGRVMMSLAAALNLEMHCVDLSQAFIQASWADLPEEVPQ
eukprot:567865-Rhodomonas_salina.1